MSQQNKHLIMVSVLFNSSTIKYFTQKHTSKSPGILYIHEMTLACVNHYKIAHLPLSACFRSSSVSLWAFSKCSLSRRISSFDFVWAACATASALNRAACSSANCSSSLWVVSLSFDSTYKRTFFAKLIIRHVQISHCNATIQWFWKNCSIFLQPPFQA